MGAAGDPAQRLHRQGPTDPRLRRPAQDRKQKRPGHPPVPKTCGRHHQVRQGHAGEHLVKSP